MDFTRAWKDPEYRASLSAEQLAALPASPVGGVELTESELAVIDGGTATPVCIPVVTAAAGCFTVNDTVCGGTCEVAGSNGCCN